jgi:hypothetical protein
MMLTLGLPQRLALRFLRIWFVQGEIASASTFDRSARHISNSLRCPAQVFPNVHDPKSRIFLVCCPYYSLREVLRFRPEMLRMYCRPVRDRQMTALASLYHK